jgi:hypothetical protein
MLQVALTHPAMRRVLMHVIPNIGFAAHRNGAPPLLDWMPAAKPGTPAPNRVVLSGNWRESAGSLVIHQVDSAARLASIGKLTWPRRVIDCDAEAERLRRLGPQAAAAGARVPRIVNQTCIDVRSVVWQEPIRGRSIAIVVSQRAALTGTAMNLVGAWLANWNRSTLTVVNDAPGQLRARFEACVSMLAPVTGEAGYGDWLRARYARVSSMPWRLVDAHHDLTAWNLLVDESGRLCVVDWALASRDSLPLADFFYAMVDIALAAQPHIGRLGALQACFAPGGRYRAIVLPQLANLRRELGLSTDLVELSLHATFASHACNEQQRLRPGEGGPFMEVAQWLASRSAVARGWILE